MKRAEQARASYQEVLNGTASVSRNSSGKLHHDTKPAIITSLRQEWYKNGMPHREDGPAIMCLDTKIVDYWVDGKYNKTENWSDSIELFNSKLWKDE